MGMRISQNVASLHAAKTISVAPEQVARSLAEADASSPNRPACRPSSTWETGAPHRH